MALIICTECGKQFSDKAAACPNCGCPTSEILAEFNLVSSNSNDQKTVDDQILKLVDDALEKARKASAAFELASDEVQKLTDSKSIDLFGNSVRQDTSQIVEAAVSACDNLYLAYQNLIPTLDGGCRPLLSKKPSAKAVKAVAGTIGWLNEESKIENNYAVTFNSVNLGNAVKAKYIPSSSNLAIQGFWEGQYSALPNHGNAESFWADKLAEHQRLTEDAEAQARKNKRDAINSYRRIEKQARQELKDKQAEIGKQREQHYQDDWDTIKQKIDYFRPASRMTSFLDSEIIYFDETGYAHKDKTILTIDSTADANDLSALKDLSQIITVFNGIIGLRCDGRIVSSKLGNLALKDDGFAVLSKWNDIIKITGTLNSVAGLKADGTCVSTRFQTNPLKQHFGQCDVSGWKNVTDIVSGLSFVAGLKNDGTVCVAGRLSEKDYSLDAAKKWTDVVQLFSCFGLIGIRRDGTVLQTGKRDLGILSEAEDIVTVCNFEKDLYVLQSDGSVIGQKEEWHGGKRAEKVKNIERAVWIFPGRWGMIALLENGTFKAFGGPVINEDVPKAVLFRNYNEYQKRANERIQSAIKSAEEQQAEAKIRDDRRFKGLCLYCGGEFEKKLFSWKCKNCGRKKDY